MDTNTSRLARHDLLGFFAHPGSLEDYLQLTAESVRDNKSTTVFYHNLHSLYSYFTSESLREHYAKKTVLVDGMPVIWLMKLFGIPVMRDHRLTYVDFIMPLMQLANDNSWTVFHVGQKSSVQSKAMELIREQSPGISIAGHDGYFDNTPHSADSLAVIEKINESRCQLLLVGFGAPKQEAWVHAHRHLINANVVFTCGACMEYVAGTVKTPPRWMGRMGLEWSFRLLENPKRFAFRYLIEPIVLGIILCRNGLQNLIANRRAG